MFRKIIFYTIVFGIILIPVIMFLAWVLAPKKVMPILIVDKTVLTPEGQEHNSFTWLLWHQKYVKANGDFYYTESDYFGFFPKTGDTFEIRDLMSYSSGQIDELSQEFAGAYYTDTYGMYYNEWFLDTLQSENSRKVYGGMDEHDFLFLKLMKEQEKLILMEFNTIGNPTSSNIRSRTEELLHIRWSGWTLRYFHLLDTLGNTEIPQWVVRGYLEQHGNQWPFRKAGIVFVHEDGRLFILEEEKDLRLEVPLMRFSSYAQGTFGLPEKVYYPYWIDITYPTDPAINVLADFYILPTQKGDSIMRKYGVPHIFPAIQQYLGSYWFYYFSGDFSDNEISNQSKYFRGLPLLKYGFANRNDLNNRSVFFYTVYFPMVKKIMKDYYNRERNLFPETP